VFQLKLACRFYDCFAAERSLALLGSCYGTCVKFEMTGTKKGASGALFIALP
jgi:surfactin synthase thioesterase subunit